MLKVLIISFLFLKIIKLHKKQKLFTLLGHILTFELYYESNKRSDN